LTNGEHARSRVCPIDLKKVNWYPLRRGTTNRYRAFTIIPIMRPNVAPIAMEGTKMPAGTLDPYDTITSNVRMKVASKREFTIRH
jgi:hypothetical protein